MADLHILQQSPQVIKLKEAFDTAYSNPEFIGNAKRVEKAEKALSMPDNTAKIINQLTTQVEKKLYTDARKAGLPDPTPEQIKAKVAEKYKEHLARKAAKPVDGIVGDILAMVGE